ncbi:hypothetical protein [Okeania sp. SIO1I7]|nr:hypothetical protein [Okeania sp. SIO1I7]
MLSIQILNWFNQKKEEGRRKKEEGRSEVVIFFQGITSGSILLQL